MLSQKKNNEILKSITFLFKKMSSTKYNYDIYDKKLMIIIRVFEKWHLKLASILIKDLI